MRRQNTAVYLALICVAIVPQVAQAQIRYVRDGVSGNGTSWASPYASLELALAAARSDSSIEEIRVAQGIYKPSVPLVTSEPTTKTFSLVPGVAVRGGFRGVTDSGGNADDIDYVVYETTLDGYLPDDDFIFVLRVVTVDACTHTRPTRLEGFTVTNGRSHSFTALNFEGGAAIGIHESGTETAPVEIAKCFITASASTQGGGVGSITSYISITECRFEAVAAIMGGAIALLDTSAQIDDCAFFKVSAANPPGSSNPVSGFGSNLWIVETAAPGPTKVTNCRFGGQADPFPFSSIPECGGLVYVQTEDEHTEFRKCLFGAAEAEAGGHLFVRDGEVIANQCTFYGGQVSGEYGSSVALIGNLQDPTLTPDLSLTSCEFGANQNEEFSSSLTGVCLYVEIRARARVTNCLFSSNSFERDTSPYPGPFLIDNQGTLDFRSSTIARNFGHGLHLATSLCNVSNSVFYNTLVFGTAEIFDSNGSAYNLINFCASSQGWAGGTGNITLSSDPLDADFFPTSGFPVSPVIDVGQNSGLPDDITDLDDDGITNEVLPWDCHSIGFLHRNRIEGGTVDMGAFELDQPDPCNPDINCDGNVDQDDVGCMIDVVAGNPGCECVDPDFNSDGNVDQDDLSALIAVVAGGPCP